jgi:hypothetical protein
MVACLGACLETGEAAAAPAEKLSQTNKADNHGLTDMATLQQMWERACPAKRRAGGARSHWQQSCHDKNMLAKNHRISDWDCDSRQNLP